MSNELLSTTPVQLVIAEACRVEFFLASSWSQQLLDVAADAPTMDREGRLPLRMIAKAPDESATLEVSASTLELPMGLAPAVVYWAEMHGFDAPECEQRWDRCSAYSGWFKTRDAGVTAVAWIQGRGAVIEIRLRGLEERQTDLQAAWTLCRNSFACEALPQEARVPTPTIWERISELRQQGRLDDALALADEEGTQAEILLVQADIHADRMRNALRVQQMEVARAAWHAAANCISAYGSSATSGGEGAARAIACKRAFAELGPQPV